MKRKRLKRNLLALVIGLIGSVAFSLMLGCCVFSAPPYKGPVSDHFDGEEFHNMNGNSIHRRGGFWKWMFNRDKGAWPDWVESEPGPAPPERVGAGELRVTFVNHATALIQMDGVNILTDPIWSDRCSPLSWIGPKRHRAPGVRFEDLPPIDVVVISHNHYDHLDIPTLRRLSETFQPQIYAGLGNKLLLDKKGIRNTTDLDWWNTVDLQDGVRLVFVPSQHWSGRGTCDRGCTLWGSFVFEGTEGNVYFAGDTGFGPHFQKVADRYGPFRLALLPIGAYLPKWFMAPAHISPAEAVEASRILNAAVTVPIHYGTFQIADDAYEQPLAELEIALRRMKLDEEVAGVTDRSRVNQTDRSDPTDRTGLAEPGRGSGATDAPSADLPSGAEPPARPESPARAEAASSSSKPQFWILNFGEGRDVPATREDVLQPAAFQAERNSASDRTESD